MTYLEELLELEELAQGSFAAPNEFIDKNNKDLVKSKENENKGNTEEVNEPESDKQP